MKFVISKIQLVELINKVLSIVATRPAIPILANILIEATDDQVTLSTTDLTTSMRCYAEAKTIEEGAISLPARRFFQLIKELTAPQVKISSITPEIVEIVAGSSTFKIHGIHRNEFPSLPEPHGSLDVSIKAKELKSLFARTSFSAARDDSRTELNGVLMQVLKQKLTLLATDGKRLAKDSSKIDIDNSFLGSYILPARAVDEMVKMLDDSEDSSHLGLMHDKIFLDFRNTTLITKLLSGQYPSVEHAIPTLTPIQVHIHREELISLLRQVSLFANEDNCSVRFHFENGLMHLFAQHKEIGEGHVSMAVDFHSSPLDIAFNPFYLIDILRHSQDETLKLSLIDSYNPGIITDSSDALFMIMPMRLIQSTPTPSRDNEAENAAFA